MKKIFINAIVITVDDSFTVYENGMVLVDEDIISHVGDMDQDKMNEFNADSVYDLDGNILMPGFINAHTHIPMTLFSGYGSGLPLKRWLEEKMWPAEAKLTGNDVYIGSKMGIAQMLLSGTTCFLDMYFFIDDIARAVSEMGIRAVLSQSLMDVGGTNNSIKECIESIEKYEDNDMIDIMVAPHAIYTNSKESLEKELDVAKQYNKPINIHVSETEFEVESSYNNNGVSPIKYLDDIGVFDVHAIAAHCVHVSDDDIRILSGKNVSVAHNPSSNLKLASGIAPIQKMIDAGVNVTIGTDGSSSNNNVDMIEEMHIAALLGKIYNGDPTALDAETIIKMATINGAKALDIDSKTGSIEVGKQADLIVIDTNSPFSQPKREYLNNLVYSIGRGQVVMTMVGGKVLQSNGEVIGLDLKELDMQFNDCVKRLC